MVVNLGTDPMADFTRRGLQLITNNVDALDYGNTHVNLIINFDILNVNSWGEASLSSYNNDDALTAALTSWLHLLPKDKKLKPKVVVQCYCKTRAESITQRVENLWNDITDAWYANQQYSSMRYLFKMANQYILFDISDQKINSEFFLNKETLSQKLSIASTEFSPLIIDKNCLSDTPLAKIFSLNKSDEIQLFYLVNKGKADLWVLDEKGSLFHQQQHFHDHITLLYPYCRFLLSVIYRQGTMANEMTSKMPLMYQLTKAAGKNKAWKIKERPLSDDNSIINYFNIQVIASKDQQGNVLYTYYCDDIEFSPLEYGENLLAAVAKQVLRHRNNEKRYPAYITDLDISALNQDSRQVTCQYLDIKKKLEKQLYIEISKI